MQETKARLVLKLFAAPGDRVIGRQRGERRVTVLFFPVTGSGRNRGGVGGGGQSPGTAKRGQARHKGRSGLQGTRDRVDRRVLRVVFRVRVENKTAVTMLGGGRGGLPRHVAGADRRMEVWLCLELGLQLIVRL